MYVKILLKYILGYVHIRIEGFFVERVMNKAANKKILFWNMKRDKSTIIYTNVGLQDFKGLIKIAKDNKCKIKILEKKGLPFIFNKYKKRKIFFAFILIICVTLFTLSNFVWNIEIDGLNNIDKEEFIKELNDDGLKVGNAKRKIDTQSIINKIRLKRNDISWVGIELTGTNAMVKIVEADAKPDLVDEQDYCNIVASKSAQIIRISAQSGTPVVKEGDIVTKGQILVAGWMEGKYTGTRYVHSSGEVKAKVWYSEKEKIPLTDTTTEQTGKTENKYEIKFNNFSINLYKTLSKFQKYDTIYTSKKMKIFSNFYLPIELIKKTNFEQEDKEIIYSQEEAKNIGMSKLSQDIENKIADKEILQKYENTYAGEDYIEVELTYEVLEDIATKEKIVF